MFLLANIHAVWMFLAGAGLLTFILLKRSHRYFGRRRRNRNEGPLDLQPRPTTKWDGAQQDTLAHIERQKVEMYDLARDLNGQLTSKIIMLEQLVADSSKQIRRMEELLLEIEQAEHDPLTVSASTPSTEQN